MSGLLIEAKCGRHMVIHFEGGYKERNRSLMTVLDLVQLVFEASHAGSCVRQRGHFTYTLLSAMVK
jgi:hypothetical protein